MLNADHDVDQDALNPELNKPDHNRPQAEQQIDVNDPSYSLSARGIELTPENITRELKALKAQDKKYAEARIMKAIEGGGPPLDKDLKFITPELVKKLNKDQQANLLAKVLQNTPNDDAQAAVNTILENAELNAINAWSFFGKVLQDVSVGPANLALLLDLEIAPQAASTSIVKSTLQDLAKTLGDKSLREYYLDDSRTDLELLEVLRHVTPEQRQNFTEAICLIASLKPQSLEFLRDKLDNIISFTPMNERADLVKNLMGQPNNAVAPELISMVLGSSASLNELRTLVSKVGEKDLLGLDSSVVNEFLAHAVLGAQVRNVKFPSDLPETASEAQIKKHLRATIKSLEKVIRLVEGNKTYAGTTVAADFLFTAQEDLRLLQEDMETYADDLSMLRSIANVNARKSELEFRYGVNISRGAGEELDHGHSHGMQKLVASWLASLNQEEGPANHKKESRWTEQDIKTIADVLSRLPEGHLLFTAMLRDIEIVSTLGEHVLGARYHKDGKIKIADITIDHLGITAAYDGKSSLAIVLAHEIGHGLQIGKGRHGIWYTEKEFFFGEGERELDFDEFVALSGWSVYDPKSFLFLPEANAVFIDDEIYPLNTPVNYKGKETIFMINYGYRILMSYDADAEFTARDYSKASPWEDFAEAFAEYVYLPKRIIDRAPGKFMHLEREFGLYKGDKDIRDHLENTLRQREEAKKMIEELIKQKEVSKMTEKAKELLNEESAIRERKKRNQRKAA